MSGFALRDGNIGLWVVVGALLTSAQANLNRKSACRITRDHVTDRDMALVLGSDAMVASDSAVALSHGAQPSHASQPIAPASGATMKARSGPAGATQTSHLTLAAEDDPSSLSRLLLTLDPQKRSAPLN